jgi:peptide/nickel transport system ATP-binding protein
MKKLREEFGASMLLITHDLGLIAEFCNKVAVMYAGKVIDSSDVITVFKKSRHPYTQALLKSTPRPDMKPERLESIPGFVPKLINPPKGCRFHPRCKYAEKICREREPPKMEISTGHIVNCWRVKKIDFTR